MAEAEVPEMLEDEEEELQGRKLGNTLSLWGNQNTMNLNNLIYTNIMQSPYFKTELIELKTYHEVIDEIYYKVEHLEPWERGSRRTSGQTGMCGGVRGVGAGGIVSTPFCLLYKLFTLKLTRKQLKGLLDHPDSPFIRALGFMYIRYCLNPQDLWDWYKDYLDDAEELDVKAGGGCTMTIGEMLVHFLTKLDWFSTLFPRIPVPIQKKLEVQMRDRRRQMAAEAALKKGGDEEIVGDVEPTWEAEKFREMEVRERNNDRGIDRSREKDRDRGRDRERDRERAREKDRERERDRNRERDRSRERDRNRERDRSRERDRDRERKRSRDRERDRGREKDRERDRRSREKDRRRDHSRPRDEPWRTRERSGDSFERDLRRERERQARKA